MAQQGKNYERLPSLVRELSTHLLWYRRICREYSTSVESLFWPQEVALDFSDSFGDSFGAASVLRYQSLPRREPQAQGASLNSSLYEHVTMDVPAHRLDLVLAKGHVVEGKDRFWAITDVNLT